MTMMTAMEKQIMRIFDYNSEDFDMPIILSLASIENKLDNDIRLDIRLSNEQKRILVNEIRYKDINKSQINEINIKEIKQLYLFFD